MVAEVAAFTLLAEGLACADVGHISCPAVTVCTRGLNMERRTLEVHSRLRK